MCTEHLHIMNPFMQRKISDLFIMLDLQEFLFFYRQLQMFAAIEGRTPHSVNPMGKVQDGSLENVHLDFWISR